MISQLSNFLGRAHTPASVFADTLRRQIRLLQSGQARWKAPSLAHLYEKHPDMPYHFNPELFIQIGGVTEFSFPHEKLKLRRGEICIVPRGMPHGELVRDEGSRFENLVISFYRGTIDIHLAHEHNPGQPLADEVHLYESELYDDLMSYLNRASELLNRPSESNAVAVRGLLMAELSLLLGLVSAPGGVLPPSTDTVELCQWLIQHNLQDENLSLESLAAELGCSPSHLSRLFHQKSGERIAERISRLRITRAKEALEETRLSVKEIAAACGYRDPRYFARVFRQVTGRTPVQFRRDAQRRQMVAVTQEPPTRPARKRLPRSG